MNELYLIWFSYISHDYILIGQLKKQDGTYIFTYNPEGALRAKRDGCILPFNINKKVYISNTLFPFFQNRIMNSHRDSIDDYLKSLNLQTYDQFKMLERTKGIKTTDNFQIITGRELDNLREHEIKHYRR